MNTCPSVTKVDDFCSCTGTVFAIDMADDEGSLVRDGTLHPCQFVNSHGTCTYLQWDPCVTCAMALG